MNDINGENEELSKLETDHESIEYKTKNVYRRIIDESDSPVYLLNTALRDGYLHIILNFSFDDFQFSKIFDKLN